MVENANQSTASVSQALEGIDFPAKREEMIRYAKEHDAPEGTLRTLENMEDREYGSMADVFKGVGDVR